MFFPLCNIAATTTTIFMPSTLKEDEDSLTEEIDLSSNEDDATSVIPRSVLNTECRSYCNKSMVDSLAFYY